MPVRRDIPNLVSQASEEAVLLGAEHILGEARQIVPIAPDGGTLARSGSTAAEGKTAVVYFDTVYAVRQHEELTWRHEPGRQAKYLEDPVNSERATVMKIMRDALAKKLGL